jgi:hypothetical protein
MFENFNIFENNIISVELAKVLTKVLDHVPSQGHLNFITIVPRDPTSIETTSILILN